MYLFYSTKEDSAKILTRYTLGTDGKLTERKTLLKFFYSAAGADHGGGGLGWDSKGNLYLGTGDDTFIGACDGFSPHDERPGRLPFDAQKSASSTKDFRGKILRITPKEDGTYTIPAGNLFTDTTKGFPEIYTMGNRNPFRFSFDPKTDWLYWGEPGPNATADSAARGPRNIDEINMTKEPGNFGWPYFIGPNKAFKKFNFDTRVVGAEWDSLKPVNSSPNHRGLDTLPRARPSIISYGYKPLPEWGTYFGPSNTNAAMVGPLYRFDAALNSAIKLPKALDNSLIIYDWGRSFIKYVKMDSTGKPLEIEQVKDGALNDMLLEFDDKGNFVSAFQTKSILQQPMDIKLGPDGALYVLCWGEWNYPHNTANGTLMRLEYIDPTVGNREVNAFYRARTFHRNGLVANFRAAQTLDIPEGVKGFDLYDMRGSKVWSFRRTNAGDQATISLPSGLPQGMLQIRISK